MSTKHFYKKLISRFSRKPPKTSYLFPVAGALALSMLFVLWRYGVLEGKGSLPPPQAYGELHTSASPEVSVSPSSQKTPSSPAQSVLPKILGSDVSLPDQINLAVPFTSQAPHKNWDTPYKEFCEEASALMAASFIKGADIPNADFANIELLKIKAFEERRFGYYEDTTAIETAIILREYFSVPRVDVRYDPDAADIKKALAEGKAVIVPAAGRELPNPYFRRPGPLYHMLVIKGYTKDGRFITNDPGTRRGADFLYDPDALLGAVHDWNGGNVEEGRRVMIVVG